jgi:DNA-binding NarL/FixJ family response regulator
MNPLACSRFAENLRAAGSDGFLSVLLSTVNESVSVDHCLLVEVARSGTLVWGSSSQLVSQMLDDTIEASCCTDRLAALKGCKHEPPAGLARDTPVALLDSTGMCAERTIGDAHRMAERLFVVSTRGESTVMLGLYRSAESRRFADADKHAISSIAEVLAALAEIHIRLCANRTAPQYVEQAWKTVLSARERAVARLLARGETARTIAALLGVAPTSVITYKKRAFVKLGISRQCELAALVGSMA